MRDIKRELCYYGLMIFSGWRWLLDEVLVVVCLDGQVLWIKENIWIKGHYTIVTIVHLNDPQIIIYIQQKFKEIFTITCVNFMDRQ